jgi:hypothetical protein
MPDEAVMLNAAFPHLPKTCRVRKDIHTRYNHFRNLRNRIFHYEPIWAQSDLVGDHDRILEVTGWISPAMHDLITPVEDRMMDGGQAPRDRNIFAY